MQNTEDPRRFTEKVQWRKLYDRNPVYTLLSDKYLVRQWVAERVGKEYLVPLLGHWKHFKDIDFSALPDQFVLKTNNGTQSNMIVKDKKEFLRKKASAGRMLEHGMDPTAFLSRLELHYFDIEPLLLAEELISPIDNESDLTDYKFHCFNGTPFMCEVIRARSTNETVDLYDMDWNLLPVGNPPYRSSRIVEKPHHCDEMIRLAGELSRGFQYVRVDLYDNGRVYFGEMTFTPASGIDLYDPDEWDYEMGKHWEIHGRQVDNRVVFENAPKSRDELRKLKKSLKRKNK